MAPLNLNIACQYTDILDRGGRGDTGQRNQLETNEIFYEKVRLCYLVEVGVARDIIPPLLRVNKRLALVL